MAGGLQGVQADRGPGVGDYACILLPRPGRVCWVLQLVPVIVMQLSRL